MIAADSAIVNTDLELEDFLKLHFELIRKNPLFADLEIVTIIEQNYGEECFEFSFMFFLTFVSCYQAVGLALQEWPPYVRSSARSNIFPATTLVKTGWAW